MDERIEEIRHIGEVCQQLFTEWRDESVRNRMQDDIPLTTQQAAVYCGVTPHTINNWAKAGKLRKVHRHGLTGYGIEQLKNIIRCKDLQGI